jgi:hypothetical protein
MPIYNANTNSLVTGVRWAARGISTAAAGFWSLILLDIIACDALAGFVCIEWEMVIFVSMVTLTILSVVIAWRVELIGGIIMIVWGMAYAAIAGITSRPYAAFSMLVTGVPFIVAGSLFFASGWLGRSATSININHKPGQGVGL